MNEPLTATMIAEANYEYWRRPDVIARGHKLDSYLRRSLDRILDIVLGRVKDGWPTRDAAAPEEDC